jgi:sucrose-6-phosphate hydrolase SacC (GH32 family)
MNRGLKAHLTRRELVTASAAMLLPCWILAAATDRKVYWWRLDERGNTVRESVNGSEDTVVSRTGQAIWVGEGRNRALRLDGYSVWVRNVGSSPALFEEGVTITAWLALESYPVNESAILELQNKSSRVFRFSIDKWGYLQFGLRPGDAKSLCRSSSPVVRGRWVHLAVSFGHGGTRLYQDGVECGPSASQSQNLRSVAEPTSVIGGAPDCPMANGVFPTGVLNCLLREMRVYSQEQSPEFLHSLMADSRPDQPADLEINGAWCVNDPQRPVCHAQPPRAWTNEPHGLIHWGGQYHIFYQKNANGPYWGHLNWGHMTSPDLLHWTELPVAISPEPGFDSEGCWSGSVIDHAGKLTLIYTGVDGKKACVCLAQSEDGVNFIKFAGNPVIAHQPSELIFQDFRDPFVWVEEGTYYLLIGSGVRDAGGTAFLYRSKDLVSWEYRKQILSGDASNSGTFWELPLFLKMGDLHALIVSEIPGRSSYWIGTWRDEKFKPIGREPHRLELFNHLLAPTPMIERDGSVVIMGIIPDERTPHELWSAGWAHLYSLPRYLSLDSGGRLRQKPHENVLKMCKTLETLSSFKLDGTSVHELEGLDEASFRLAFTFVRGKSSAVSLLVRRSPDGREQTEVAYDWERQRMVLDRTHSSLDQKVRRDRQEVEYAIEDGDILKLEVFVDRSVIEVFVDDRATFAARIYPTLPASTFVGFTSVGQGAEVRDLQAARLQMPSLS